MRIPLSAIGIWQGEATRHGVLDAESKATELGKQAAVIRDSIEFDRAAVAPVLAGLMVASEPSKKVPI